MQQSENVPGRLTGRRAILYLAVVVLATVTAAYSNHFHNGFHFDDSHTIVNNVYIRNIRNIPLFFEDGTTFSSLPTNQSYRPLVTATLALDYYFGKGLHPFYFHLSTFILFLIQGVLMYFLYLRLFDLSFRDGWMSFVALGGVALYLLHPANADTINYIIARSDSLSTLFIVLAFVLYLYSPFSRKWHLYLIPVAIGTLAKPIAAVFAPLLAAFLLVFPDSLSSSDNPGPHGRGRAVAKSLPSMVFSVLLLLFIKHMDPATWRAGGASFYRYVITQPYVLLHYFTTFFLPVGLSADTDWKPFSSVWNIRFLGGLLFVVLLIAAGYLTARRRRTRPIAFGVFWFFLSLLPTSLIPLAEVTNDHRIFLPYVGLAMAVCWSAALLIGRLAALLKTGDSPKRTALFRGASVSVVMIVLAGCAFGTYQRNKVWKSDETLWKDVTEKSPLNGRGLMNYGLVLMKKADFAGARTYFMKAYRLIPEYPYLNINLGILSDAEGKPEEAEKYFMRAIAYGPGYPACYFYYGRFLWKQGRAEEAEINLRKVLQLAPAHLEARHLLMYIYYERSQTSKLKDLVDQTLRLSPGDARSNFYLALLKAGKTVIAGATQIADGSTPEGFLESSLSYYRKGDYRKSIEAARQALRLRPNYDLAYNNICAAYNALGEWDRAIAAGEKAVKLNPDNQLARDNLAWAIRQEKLNERK